MNRNTHNIDSKSWLFLFVSISLITCFVIFAYISNFKTFIELCNQYDVFSSGLLMGIIEFIISVFAIPIMAFGNMNFDVYMMIAYILLIIVSLFVTILLLIKGEYFYNEGDFNTITSKQTYDLASGRMINETISTPEDKAFQANFWAYLLFILSMIVLPYITLPVIVYLLFHYAPFSSHKWYISLTLTTVELAVLTVSGYILSIII